MLNQLLNDEDRKLIEELKTSLNFSDEEFNKVVNILIPEVTNAIGQSMNDGSLMLKLMNVLSTMNLGESTGSSESLLSVQAKESGRSLLDGILGAPENVNHLYDKISSDVNVEREKIETLLPALAMAVVSVVMKNGPGVGGLLNGMLGTTDS